MFLKRGLLKSYEWIRLFNTPDNFSNLGILFFLLSARVRVNVSKRGFSQLLFVFGQTGLHSFPVTIHTLLRIFEVCLDDGVRYLNVS